MTLQTHQALFIPDKGTVPAGEPGARLVQQMFGFERVSVAPGDSTTLSFEFTPDQLEVYNAAGDRVV